MSCLWWGVERIGHNISAVPSKLKFRRLKYSTTGVPKVPREGVLPVILAGIALRPVKSPSMLFDAFGCQTVVQARIVVDRLGSSKFAYLFQNGSPDSLISDG